MALSDLDYIRLTLSIPHRLVLGENLTVGDGVTVLRKTQLAPIIAETETITVNGVIQERDADYIIDDDLGLITFATAPEADAVIEAGYTWSVFSDAQINGLLIRYGGSVIRATLDLVRAMLSNSDLFIKYTLGMESVDRTTALDSLKTLWESLKEEMTGSLQQAVIFRASDKKADQEDVPWAAFLDSTLAESS